MLRVALMEDYLDQARGLDVVRRLAQRVDLAIHTTKAGSPDEVVRRLQGMDIAITIRDRVMFTADVFARLDRLRLLSVCGPRLDPHVDLPAATRAGVLVCPAPPNRETNLPHLATADLTWCLILGLARDVLHNHAQMQRGAWQSRAGMGLAGKTLGVVGSTGKVGAPVARIGQAMGMRVLAWSPSLTPERAAAQGVESVTLDELLQASDVVTLHANATPGSRGMIGARELGLMRPHALLINTARAALVDEQALRQALDGGVIAGAGLDVYWQEPLPAGHWLRTHERVLLQPHLGGFTREGYEWLVAPGVQTVLDHLDGRPVHAANPEAATAGRASTGGAAS